MKPAVIKLPLLTRKNLRDNWEAKKSEYEKQLSTALGDKAAWTITFDPALIYANCEREDLHDRIADAITWYVEPLITNAKRWADDFGSEGLVELDALCTKHTVEIKPQEETKFTYGGLVITEGVLQLVYAEGQFVTNVDDVTKIEAFTEAIKVATLAGAEGASDGKLDVEAKKDIRDNWEAKKEELRKKIAAMVTIDDVVLEPEFEQIAVRLVENYKPKDKNEEYRYSHELKQNLAQIGAMAYRYFEALESYLRYEKFGEDDMLQEAIQEAIPSKKIGLRVVDKLEKKSYCETVFEDGVMWMQTTASEWRTNVDDAPRTILELL